MLYSQTIMYKEILQQPTVCKKLLKLNHQVLSLVAERVKSGNIEQIVTGARGSSANACTYFAYLAEIFTRYPVKILAPSVLTSYDGAMKLSKSLVIGVSQSGKAEDVLYCLERAKKDGSITLAITNDENSPIAKTAEYHIFLDVGKEESVAATKTVSASMYVLMLLVLYISGDPLLTNSHQIVINGIKKVLDNTPNIVEFAKTLVDTKDIFVLARGLNQPIALETALKLAETTYTKAMAYSVSDFWHGPYAMIDQYATVLVYAPLGQSQSDVLKMVDRCKSSGAKVIVIATQDIADCDITIPDGTDIETPFYNLVTAQILACALSTQRGLNPDKPRGLNKVTITK